MQGAVEAEVVRSLAGIVSVGLNVVAEVVDAAVMAVAAAVVAVAVADDAMPDT